MDFDVIIVGGGPAGLSFARSLADSGLRLALVERQAAAQLADPGYDGREIALTHRSIRILSGLGAWSRLPADEISSLRAARVLNGGSQRALTFDTGGLRQAELGKLVSNHHIRRALYQAVQQQPGLALLAGTEVCAVAAGADGAEVSLATGEVLRGRLLVAADSRLSETRRQLGITAEVNRLGRAMLVCRVEHERDHEHVATEWFDHHQTIAMLPLNGCVSSAVITLPQREAEDVAALDDETFGAEVTRRYGRRLGTMRVASTRHLYPLVTTFARQFAVGAAALVGDAAVGMHPVTAHGFNLGLSGQARLAREMLLAARRGADIAGAGVLRRYAAAHRRASWPLYAGTNLLVRLYTDERLPGRAMRHAALRLGDRLPLVRNGVRAMLLDA